MGGLPKAGSDRPGRTGHRAARQAAVVTVLALAFVAVGLAVRGGTASPGPTVPAPPPSAGGSSPGPATGAPHPPPSRVRLPPTGVPWDYQLGGDYPPARGVRVVSRDHGGEPVAGLYNVCYVNAFQTQPGESTDWPSSLVLHDRAGRPVQDPDWPGEYLLDTRTATNRRTIAAVLRPWLADCARRGFAAVEPDNLDSWTRSQGLLSSGDNVALARLIVLTAHSLGLAVAQKNAPEVAPSARELGFDFAVVEDCQEYQECDPFLSAYGDRVFEVEYADAGPDSFRTACRERGHRISVLYRDRDLLPAGRPGHVFEAC